MIEKPIAVDRNQLQDLLAAMESSTGQIFECFQKRYSPFNAWVRDDLGIEPNAPISYHCIVFEEPLPRLHWYRWPNSKSRLVSNGCHWIDHFLHLNNFAPPLTHDLTIGPRGTLNVSIELKNNGISGYIYPSGRGTSHNTELKNEYGLYFNSIKWLGFVLAIVGTIIWGYGDIPFGNT